MSARLTYDEARDKLRPCACGRLVTNPTACVSAGTCLLGERERQIAGIRQRQEERRDQVLVFAVGCVFAVAATFDVKH